LTPGRPDAIFCPGVLEMNAPGTAQSVVIRFLDGGTLKGGTHDFAPNKPEFHVQPRDEKSAPARISLATLKAVFFVKSLEGNKYHVEDKSFGRTPEQGRRIKVTFKDGEEIVGFTSGYAPDRPGFFVVPTDPASNNHRIFVVNSAVGKVEWLPAGRTPQAAVAR
jgi:hypothetical protein